MLYLQFADGVRMPFFDCTANSRQNFKYIRAVASEGRRRKAMGKSSMGKFVHVPTSPNPAPNA